MNHNSEIVNFLYENGSFAYVCKMDEQFTLLKLEGACLQITGFSNQEMLDKLFSFSDRIVEDDRRFVHDYVDQAVKNNHWYDLNYGFTRKNGEIIMLTDLGRVIEIGGDKFLAGFIFESDDTPVSFKDIINSEQYLNDLFSSPIGLGIYSIDLNCRYINFNVDHYSLCKKIFGHEIRSGFCVLDMFDAEEREAYYGVYRRAFSGESVTETKNFTLQNNEIIMLDIEVNPLFGQSNEVKGASVLVKDVTSKKEIELRLEETRKLVVSLTDNVSVGIMRLLPPNKVVFVNKGFLRTLEIDDDRIDEISFQSLFVSKKDVEIIESVLERNNSILSFPVRMLREKTKKEVWISVSITKYVDYKGVLYHDISILDVTDELDALTVARRSKELIHATNEFAMDLMIRDENDQINFDHALRNVGKRLKVSRAYIYQFELIQNEVIANRCYFWDDNIGIFEDNVFQLNLSHSGLFKWYELLKNRSVIATIVADLGDFEREFFSAKGVQSLAMYPIFVDDDLWGIIGFDDCDQERVWSDAEIQSLRNISNSIASVIKQNAHIEELKIARQKAEELSNMKTNFLANMSHEIRTPLNGIIGLTDLIESEVSGNDALLEYIDILKESSYRLLNTITSILNFSRLEGTGVAIEIEEFDLVSATNEMIPSLRILAEKKGLKLLLTVQNDRLMVNMDKTIFKQILTNLIGNAIKFTAKGSVTCDISVVGSENQLVSISVRDTGIGMSADFIPHVFDAFRQESQGQARQFQGSGLGLSIVKKYIEMFGGNIKVESVKGKGSVFTVRLPLTAQEQLNKLGLQVYNSTSVMQ